MKVLHLTSAKQNRNLSLLKDTYVTVGGDVLKNNERVQSTLYVPLAIVNLVLHGTCAYFFRCGYGLVALMSLSVANQLRMGFATIVKNDMGWVFGLLGDGRHEFTGQGLISSRRRVRNHV